MTTDALDSPDRDFLFALFEKTGGETALQFSMYAIGEALGLDREMSARTAEKLMALELVEVRTLSGGVGMSRAGVEAALRLGVRGDAPAAYRLENAPVLDGEGKKAVEDLILAIKNAAGGLRLPYDRLEEMVADIRTLDAQLASPRPRTAVIRACLSGLRTLLEGAGAREPAGAVKTLLGE